MPLELSTLEYGFRRLVQTDRQVEGLSVAAIRSEFPKVAKQLEREIRAGQFQMQPLVPFHLHVGGKKRTLYRAAPLDQAVLFALARIAATAVEPFLSPSCYSYRRGRSPRDAHEAIVEYLRDHVARRELKQRGLFVIRTDIVAYGESIRVDEQSPLWQQLEEAFPEPRLRRLMLQAIRQPVRQITREVAPLDRGIPTGSPIQPPFCNLYLAPIDDALSEIPGLLYSRYGDDILLAHEEPAVAIESLDVLRRRCQERGLELSAGKTRRTFWNGAGRAAPAVFADFIGRQSFDYLGASVSFSGFVAPTAMKRRAFLTSLRARLEAACALSDDAPLEERGRVACRVLCLALDPGELLAEPYLEIFFGRLADRTTRLSASADLELLCAEVIARRRGRRAFRQAPPRKLREWGFPRLDIFKRDDSVRKGARDSLS